MGKRMKDWDKSARKENSFGLDVDPHGTRRGEEGPVPPEVRAYQGAVRDRQTLRAQYEKYPHLFPAVPAWWGKKRKGA